MLAQELLLLERRFEKSILSRIQDKRLDNHGVELWLKRDDLLHPVISGNKWRKLKYILNHALALKTHTVVSMGGAYSNQLHALAYVGRELGLKTRAFIRGEQPARFSPTLLDLQGWGMQLDFISRSDYRELRQYKNHDSLPGTVCGEYWLPEGGATELALQGVEEIVAEIDMPYDILCVACGTGTTLAGLVKAVPESRQVLGIAALKGAAYLQDEVGKLLQSPKKSNWAINLDYHCGGFAKITPQLLAFIEQFERQHNIALDQVYNAKMMWAVFDLLEQGYFKRGQRIVAIHTGGLQGMRSLM